MGNYLPAWYTRGMLDNNLYDLMAQAVQEQKSLWRITQAYREDAEGDDELTAFWEQLAEEKNAQLSATVQLLHERLSAVAEAPIPDEVAAPAADGVQSDQ